MDVNVKIQIVLKRVQCLETYENVVLLTNIANILNKSDWVETAELLPLYPVFASSFKSSVGDCFST